MRRLAPLRCLTLMFVALFVAISCALCGDIFAAEHSPPWIVASTSTPAANRGIVGWGTVQHAIYITNEAGVQTPEGLLVASQVIFRSSRYEDHYYMAKMTAGGWGVHRNLGLSTGVVVEGRDHAPIHQILGAWKAMPADTRKRLNLGEMPKT